jgi:peptide/nickel transport system substrate-binding protein
LHLAPNVKWQNVPPLNGRKFTAADVVYAYKRYASEGAQTAYFVDMDSVTAVDDATVRIALKRPAVDFLYPLGSRVLTIFPRETVEDGTISKVSIGTGPMILKELKPSASVTFVKNPEYFARQPLLDGLELRIMIDAAARQAAFRAGQIATGNAIADKASDVKRLLDAEPKL